MNGLIKPKFSKSPVPTAKTPARLMLPKVIFVVEPNALKRRDMVRRIVTRPPEGEIPAHRTLFENKQFENEKSEGESVCDAADCKQLFYAAENIAVKRLATDWFDWLNALRIYPQTKQIIGVDDLPQLMSEPDEQLRIKFPGYASPVAQRGAERFVDLLMGDYATRIEMTLGVPHVGFALALAGIGNIWRRQSELLRLIKTVAIPRGQPTAGALNVSSELAEKIYSHGAQFVFAAKSISFVFSSVSQMKEINQREIFTDPGDLGDLQTDDFIHFNPLMKRWSVKRAAENLHISDTADHLNRADNLIR